jgi:hypothetical protein
MNSKEFPPLPKKKPAVFHHPQGFALYDSVSMDLHAMAYAEACVAAVGPGRTSVDSGALKMTLNVLRRAGKNDVSDALEATAIRDI